MNSINFIGLPQELQIEILGFSDQREITKYRCINRYFCELIDTHEKIFYSEVEIEVKKLYPDFAKYEKQLNALEKLKNETWSIRVDIFVEMEKIEESTSFQIVKNTPSQLQPLYLLSDSIMKEIEAHRKLEFKLKKVDEKYKEIESYLPSFRSNYNDTIEKIDQYLRTSALNEIKLKCRVEDMWYWEAFWNEHEIYESITKNLSKELKYSVIAQGGYATFKYGGGKRIEPRKCIIM